jgi:phosphodiester glycosidase
MSKRARLLVAVALVASAFIAAPARSTTVPGYQVLRNIQIAPGLNYKKLKDAAGPNRIHVLTMNPSRRLTLDVALAGNQLGHAEKTTSMAARLGAIAAINGDFGTWSGRPAFGFMLDGALKISPTCCPKDFAIRRNERRTFFGVPEFGIKLWELDSNEHWTVQRWNFGRPSSGQIAGYTMAGGSFAKPPRAGCSARLLPKSDLVWSGTGLGRQYVVDQALCHDHRLSRDKALVLSAVPGTDQAQELRTLKPGEKVRLQWTFGWPGIMDNMGGTPELMRGGAVVATNCSAPLCRRHPRTGIGRRGDGRLLLVVVDGRRKGSVGMTLLEFAKLFRNLGATDALNLDGGGSSTMVVKGAIMNRPSDGVQRPVVNSLLVLPGPDRREQRPASGFAALAAASAESTAPPEDVPVPEPDLLRRFRSAAALDAGSSGGMVDALARGALGRSPSVLPPDFLSVLKRFRRSSH